MVFAFRSAPNRCNIAVQSSYHFCYHIWPHTHLRNWIQGTKGPHHSTSLHSTYLLLSVAGLGFYVRAAVAAVLCGMDEPKKKKKFLSSVVFSHRVSVRLFSAGTSLGSPDSRCYTLETGSENLQYMFHPTTCPNESQKICGNVHRHSHPHHNIYLPNPHIQTSKHPSSYM